MTLENTLPDKARAHAWLRPRLDDFALWPGHQLRQFIMDDAIRAVAAEFSVSREGAAQTAYWPPWLVSWVEEVAHDWWREDKVHRAIKDAPD